MMFALPKRAREDIPPPVGRRMVVKCLAPGCEHAALVDQRRFFSNPRDWPKEGRSTRFRCVCGGREAEVRYTRHAHGTEGTLHPAVLALWY